MAQASITITRQDAANLTGLSTRTVDRLIAAKKLRTAPVGRRRLIFRESLNEFLQGQVG